MLLPETSPLDGRGAGPSPSPWGTHLEFFYELPGSTQDSAQGRASTGTQPDLHPFPVAYLSLSL